MRVEFAAHIRPSLREMAVGDSCCLAPRPLLSTKPFERTLQVMGVTVRRRSYCRLFSADVLSLLAELATAIAGFSGIVAVFGRRTAGRWRPAESARLVGLLYTSLVAALFSVLPLVLFSVPVSEPMCWRVLSPLLAASLLRPVVSVLRIISQTKTTPIDERESSLAMSWFLIVGNGSAITVLLVNAIAWSTAWPYLAGILWALVNAAVLFARLVIIPLSSPTPDV